MKKNVIILTHGWTGSSAFTALISQAGYWLGDETFQKIDYNTYENSELVALNNKMIEDIGYQGDREHEIINEQLVSQLSKQAEALDSAPYQEFVNKLNQNQPWIWKDPRLALTIRIWAKYLDLENIAFVILTRNDEQSWITSNQRRHIQSLSFTKQYNHAVTNSFKSFLRDNDKDYVEFQFEDLQLKPEDTVAKLNEFLDISLSMDDVRAVYKKPLYKKSKSFKDKLNALAIYLKNYHLRDGRQQRS